MFWTVVELKEILRELGLPVSGNKTKLCDRLIADRRVRLSSTPKIKLRPIPATVLPTRGSPVGAASQAGPAEPQKSMPTLASPGAAAIRAFLQKNRVYQVFVCHVPSPILEKSTAAVVYCLPSEELADQLKRLSALIRALTPVEQRQIMPVYSIYRDWIKSLVDRSKLVGKERTLVVDLDERGLILNVLSSVPLVHRFFFELRRVGMNPVARTLLNCDRVLPLGPEFKIAKWYLGVLFRAMSSAVNSDDARIKTFIAENGEKIAKNAQDFLDSC
ncbi:MAG: SAP domain-containing protein [Sulfobacillus sp.]